jgi:hypothetical protein
VTRAFDDRVFPETSLASGRRTALAMRDELHIAHRELREEGVVVRHGRCLHLYVPRYCEVSYDGNRHTRIVPSRLPADAAFLPSGENVTQSTSSVCPSKRCNSAPVSTSHNRTVLINWFQLVSCFHF